MTAVTIDMLSHILGMIPSREGGEYTTSQPQQLSPTQLRHDTDLIHQASFCSAVKYDTKRLIDFASDDQLTYGVEFIATQKFQDLLSQFLEDERVDVYGINLAKVDRYHLVTPQKSTANILIGIDSDTPSVLIQVETIALARDMMYHTVALDITPSHLRSIKDSALSQLFGIEL